MATPILRMYCPRIVFRVFLYVLLQTMMQNAIAAKLARSIHNKLYGMSEHF